MSQKKVEIGDNAPTEMSSNTIRKAKKLVENSGVAKIDD